MSLRALLTDLRTVPHYTVMVWRVMSGRLYVARDRPDWVVARFAGIKNGHLAGPEFERVVADCCREHDLRGERKRREAEMQRLLSAATESAKQGPRA